jgi:hypothetical protein
LWIGNALLHLQLYYIVEQYPITFLTRKDIYLVIYKSNIVTSLDSVHFLVLVALEVLEIRSALVLNLVPITNSFVIEIATAKLDMEFQRIRNIKG